MIGTIDMTLLPHAVFCLTLMLMLGAGSADSRAAANVTNATNTADVTNAATAPESQADWISYRDAYRTMLWFEKYGQAKHLIQNRFQVVATSPAAAANAANSPVQLTLVGKSLRLNLPLDATGRTVLPLLKAAYDENAALQLNHQRSGFTFRSRVTIAVRADGIYQTADLRAACLQVQAYQNWRDASVLRGKSCVGVRFVFAKDTAAGAIAFRQADQTLAPLSLVDGAAFDDGNAAADEGFRVADWLFSGPAQGQGQVQGQGQGQVLMHSAPLAISALFE
jgi:hypothetical protein